MEEVKSGIRHESDPLLNRCKFCGKLAGKRYEYAVNAEVGRYLLKDARGGVVCNKCADAGLLIKPQKLNKAETKKFKKMKRELDSFSKIHHVTLDAEGAVIK